MASDSRVFVTGHAGMLGFVVCEVFRRAGWTVTTTDQRFDGRLDGPFVEGVLAEACPVIVNCAGTTPARANAAELVLSNAVLPQVLATCGGLLIHASTDGVFSGRRGLYRVTEAPDATDAYGLSKRLGERCVELGRAVVLRTSIVGLDVGAPRSLISWYLAQSEPVPGYENVRWNGITTLEWAHLALRVAAGDPAFQPGIHQPVSPSVASKAELLLAVRSAFGRGPDVVPTEAEQAVDRSLLGTWFAPPLSEQLTALARWHEQ